MANTEKDRFGDTLRRKEKGQEEEYFARRERELIENMRDRQHAPAEVSKPAPTDSSGGPSPANPDRAGNSLGGGGPSSRGGEADVPAQRGWKRRLGRLLGGSGTA